MMKIGYRKIGVTKRVTELPNVDRFEKRKTDLEYGMVKDYGYVIIFIGWLIVSSQLRV